MLKYYRQTLKGRRWGKASRRQGAALAGSTATTKVSVQRVGGSILSRRRRESERRNDSGHAAMPRGYNDRSDERMAGACVNSADAGRRKTIPTPHFSSVDWPEFPRKFKNTRVFDEFLSDERFLKKHRPLELAERRARKREIEVAKYYRYIQRLREECPQLWK